MFFTFQGQLNSNNPNRQENIKAFYVLVPQLIASVLYGGVKEAPNVSVEY